MAATTVDVPAIVLSGGPMLDGWHDGELVGSGTVIWRSRRKLAAGEITEEQFLEAACASAPSAGHCNTMGTASTMNAVAEALGLSLPGCAAIPAPYRERGEIAYETGRRIVEMAYEDLRPAKILSRDAFLNALAVVTAIGGSSNAQPHVVAIARHAGVAIEPKDWLRAYDLPLLLNMQPAGKYLLSSSTFAHQRHHHILCRHHSKNSVRYFPIAVAFPSDSLAGRGRIRRRAEARPGLFHPFVAHLLRFSTLW